MFTPARQRAALLLALGLVAVTGVAGCGSSPARSSSPAQSARARIQFLRQHAVDLDREQVRQIRRLPHGQPGTLDRDMTRVLAGEEVRTAIDAEQLGNRRRLLGRHVNDAYQPEPAPPGHFSPAYEAYQREQARLREKAREQERDDDSAANEASPEDATEEDATEEEGSEGPGEEDSR